VSNSPRTSTTLVAIRDRMLAGPSVGVRADTAKQVGALLSADLLTQRERRTALAILETLAKDVEQQVRYALARHVESWGRADDTGFVAYDAKQKDELLGAVWLRLATGDQRDETKATPELAFAVKPGLRRRGIGAALLTQLVKATPQQSTISISAPANNPAVRLYERFGFKVVEQSEGALTMRREA